MNFCPPADPDHRVHIYQKKMFEKLPLKDAVNIADITNFGPLSFDECMTHCLHHRLCKSFFFEDGVWCVSKDKSIYDPTFSSQLTTSTGDMWEMMDCVIQGSDVERLITYDASTSLLPIGPGYTEFFKDIGD